MSSSGGSTTPILNPPAEVINPADEEFYASWGLCILCLLLIGALITSYYLQIKRIRAVHETVVSIFAGMVVGLIIRLSPGHMIREMLSFKHTFFFNALLPPIILNSGYELKQENFFRNFGVILTFAFLGTFISAVGIGVLVYIWSFLGLEGLKFTLLECLIFGSTLSATDPVTILAIFNTAKVDPKLYSIIFGESILNDAVSIVMYETLSQFHGEDIYLSSLFHGVGIFLFSFLVSMALGVAFGLACSLGLKHSHLATYPHIESCLVALVAYTSYFFSNGIAMSGIVSLLFCGITLKHYAYHTMSKRTQRTTKYMFAVLAQLSENFIFIYLGLNLFTQDVQVFKPLFILVSAIAVMASRYAAVFPLSELINWVFHTRGQRYEELPHSYQMMLFWAGLRGAVGVALAAGITGDNADALRTTILVVVVLTVIIFGGTTARMLEVLGIRVGVEDEDASSDDEAEGWTSYNGNLALSMGPGSRRYAGQNGRGYSYGGGEYDDNEIENGIDLHSPENSPYISSSSKNQLHLPRSRQASMGARSTFGTNNSRSGFSTNSESDDNEEVLPSAGPSGEYEGGRNDEEGGVGGGLGGIRPGMIFRDGQWFTALDERYLLPLFSNSVTARRHHAKKATRKVSSSLYNAAGEREGRGGESGHGTPRGGNSLELNRGGQGQGTDEDYAYDGESENGKVKSGLPRTFSGSVTDFFFAKADPSSSTTNLHQSSSNMSLPLEDRSRGNSSSGPGPSTSTNIRRGSGDVSVPANVKTNSNPDEQGWIWTGSGVGEVEGTSRSSTPKLTKAD
ncbi:sodium/hydrogen exchanger 3 [Kwoniella mangroviensis CBS 8507]|uniref:sodium/hydrogen exchanger 3 n=1 Tax=Kwoniella mangroviensis CBS 8507 TaxID=1296122 RepID=UPI00080CECA1|nr:sodium/hydrogen exchanger 3 [Kwoniella mangroviensis CBS 8507]OCF67534.1 sodium/hydrogen exchanger 3 [Kwoniella mangroviensis CBS 8507]